MPRGLRPKPAPKSPSPWSQATQASPETSLAEKTATHLQAQPRDEPVELDELDEFPAERNNPRKRPPLGWRCSGAKRKRRSSAKRVRDPSPQAFAPKSNHMKTVGFPFPVLGVGVGF